uniref:CKK domain-containing protein n=1 Tax=Clastoptera arizonana TaxID=38151 RepID=A0A1B6CT79_9HEMI
MVLRLATLLRPSQWQISKNNSRMEGPATNWTTAKQKATVKWMLSKAFNNNVPENLKEPFYRDHEDQEHLKPQLVHSLANAELYCFALANIYSDPNYHNLNHSGVLQALARKGIFIPDAHLTETVLIQTNPLKLSAHMSVMEAVMTLYAKEVATPDRVCAAVQRFRTNSQYSTQNNLMPTDHEQALLLWINEAVSALKERTQQEGKEIRSGNGDKILADFPKISDLQEICDGVSLAALIAFYCPEDLDWNKITLNRVPTVSDRLRNLLLVNDFCLNSLPYSVFHMMPEDVSYMRGTMQPNLVVFLADLFNVLEIHPAKCVRFDRAAASLTQAYPRNSQGVAHKRCLPQSVSAIPDLRSGLDSHSSGFSGSPMVTSGGLKKSHSSHQSETFIENRSSEDVFVVHRGRAVPTLSSVINNSSDSQNQSTNSTPVRKPEAAGKPSNWEDSRRSSYAGRRSRRNSLSDDSQLTWENFGGSQEHLHLLGRNPDKEPAIHVGGRDSSSAQAIRSTQQDNHSVALHSTIQVSENETNHRPQRASAEDTRSSVGLQSLLLDPPSHNNNSSNKKTTFAALPQTITTWQQQQQANTQIENLSSETENGTEAGIMGSQLLNIRLKLEEKRRRIENDKRRMEAVMNRQREKLGKAAFLQAVTKGQTQGKPNSNVKSPESDPGKTTNGEIDEITDKPQRPFSLQDITEVEQKWLGENFTEERKTPDMDSMDIETYQQSIAQMNTSLHEIQADLQRLTTQQNQISSPAIQNPHTPPIQVHQNQMSSFATLNQNSFVNNRSQVNYSQPQQVHSLVYNNSQWHSLQQPNNFISQQNQQNNYVSQQQHQVHSLINQQSQPIMSNFATMRQFSNQQPGYISPVIHNFGDTGSYNQPQVNTLHQQQQVNQILRGNSQDVGNSGEFYLHDPPHSQRRNWSAPEQPRNHWNNNSHGQSTTLSSSPFGGGSFMLHHNGSSSGGGSSPPASLTPTPPPRRITHAPLPTPTVDDMEPQSISFIGTGEDELSTGLNRIQITSGTRTYRIPSPTRSHASLTRTSFSSPTPQNHTSQNVTEKGFYISFDDDTPPKRPKPPLRIKRASPKKERTLTQVLDSGFTQSYNQGRGSDERVTPPKERTEYNLPVRVENSSNSRLQPNCTTRPIEPPRVPPPRGSTDDSSGVGLVIGNELVSPDPSTLDEMERKKEKILMMSLARRQAQEELKARKENEAARRKEAEKFKEEEKLRKKEEEKARRAAILDQYKLKKAIEEAEREGKLLDKELLNSLKSGIGGNIGSISQAPKLRNKTQPSRPRPKTIHIDSGSDTHDGMLTPSRGKKGSSSNLSVFSPPSTMKRDYYRGSQDCLAETRRTSASISSDIGDDSRGTSPGRTLGRRGSYKTSRDSSLEPARNRSKFATYQSQRKSNSLMNLSGSSCDQDSLLYRYGDTDSGLGRATPPRRVPSPGHHPPSPSGPGSLPAHRRRFDDAASESGSSEYSGPRLYKQPATKSNKGIILNAVEYCVFPGVVNREAKRLVIEEINRSEAKHFLVLFRDTGCQFRALYSYCPETEEVAKLYGTGPKLVSDRMFDKFFKYNSGGKCFSQVHTKHLTVTIDAFTIHNSLWQGKKMNLPNKKDMTLVI